MVLTDGQQKISCNISFRAGVPNLFLIKDHFYIILGSRDHYVGGIIKINNRVTVNAAVVGSIHNGRINYYLLIFLFFRSDNKAKHGHLTVLLATSLTALIKHDFTCVFPTV